MKDDQQLCTFYLDGHLCGVPVEYVQEIIRYQQMTPVPLAPKSVEGLINLRGQVVMAIDLRRRLAMPDRGEDQRPINVVVHSDNGVVSFLVDEIGDVQTVGEATFEPPLNTMPEPLRRLTRGVYKLEDQLLLVLDGQKAMDISAN